MSSTDLDTMLSEVRTLLERGDISAAVQQLELLRTPEQADLISDLESRNQVALLSDLDHGLSADIVEELDDHTAAELVADLPTEKALRIIEAMEPDKVADLLGDLPPQLSASLLARLQEAEDIQSLLLHPDETAGGLMTSEFLTFRPQMTVSQALKALRAWHPEGADLNEFYVVDAEKKLLGAVSLRRLVIAEPLQKIAEIMAHELITVRAGLDQEAVANLMTRYDLLALPVVDRRHHLLGIITIDDVVDVLVDEATEDAHRMGGALPLDLPYLKTSVLSVTRKRIGWLLLLFITESLTGSVLRHFETQLQSVVALSFFIPLLIGTGGNAGTQTTSTIIRSLAIGEIDIHDALQALWHEARTGMLMGLVMAVLAYGRALLWGSAPALALTVSIAVFVIIVWANILGSLLPILASRLRIDPAVVSGPMLSTLVDATGLFVYLTIASLILLGG